MSDKGTPEPPNQGELFTPLRTDKPGPEAVPKASSPRTLKAASQPKAGRDPSPELKPKRKRSARPKEATQMLADLALPTPSAMSEPQITEELAWHKARVRDLQSHLRAKLAAASSAAKRQAGQLSAEVVYQTVERFGGGYGAQVRAARELNVSPRTIARKLRT